MVLLTGWDILMGNKMFPGGFQKSGDDAQGSHVVTKLGAVHQACPVPLVEHPCPCPQHTAIRQAEQGSLGLYYTDLYPFRAREQVGECKF